MTFPILWHSNAPWVPTGYGQQTALFVPRIMFHGYPVAVSALYGLGGAPTQWNGITVLPNGQTSDGVDVVAGHATVHFGGKNGLVIALADAWTLQPQLWQHLNHAVWIPIDTHTLSAMDKAFIDAAHPKLIAMSKHGLKCLNQAGYDATYIPHGIDTRIFNPNRDRTILKSKLGIPDDAFVIGINAANKGVPSRKAFAQQFLGIANAMKKHSDIVLALHTNPDSIEGESLTELIEACRIDPKRVYMSNPYMYRAGLFTADYMADWYSMCDVLSNATMGEGFGVPTIESQACGTPVILTNTAASKDLCGAGWKVTGTAYWNDPHKSWWTLPDPGQLTHAYETAYSKAANMRDTAAGFGKKYDADLITKDYWLPYLDANGGA